MIALLKQAQTDTSVFPSTISEEEYYVVKANPQNYPDWYVGLVGFNSFGARWFEGYPRGFKADGVTKRDIVAEGIRNIIKQAPKLWGIEFSCKSYEECNNLENYVIYCDIPYKDTKKYRTPNFDYERFYDWCKEMSKNNIVLISEYSMPDDFECIWEQELIRQLDVNKNNNFKVTEKLFKWKG